MRWIIIGCSVLVVLLLGLLVLVFPSGQREETDQVAVQEQPAPEAPAEETTPPDAAPAPAAEPPKAPEEPPAPQVVQPTPAPAPQPARPGAPFRLALPVDCVMNTDCFIQQYPDADTGPGWQDFMCGHLSYDGHKGTDFRVRNRQMMRDGVPVVAGAGGTVQGIRDGMRDIDVTRIGGPQALDGKDCGNGVLIDHGDGWTTQYCHLKQGSVLVAKGQRVATGERLGLIGMSGAAAFPHLHLTLRKDNRVVDPYRGLSPAVACGGSYAPLWADSAVDAVAYRAGGLLTIGMHGDPDKSFEDVKEGRGNPQEVSASAPALVAWSHVYGIQKDDIVRTRVTGPDGATVLETESKPHPKNQAQAFKWVGKRNRGGFAPGGYTALIELVRNGRVHDAWQTTVTVR